MQVPPLDLKSQYQAIKKEADSALAEVINSQHFVLGPIVEKLEVELAGYLKTKYAIAVASGSDALLIALMALKIGPGDEIITTPFTFFATGGAIARLGARPVFVDIDPATYNISPAKIRSYLGKSSKKAKAIMPVHLYGQASDMSEIMAIGNEYKIPVIEDAAQSLGSDYAGRKTGTIGLMGCYSFYPTKNLGGWGDAGLVTTDDEPLAKLVKTLRVHGAENRYFHQYIGLNSRLDALQAAILRVKLRYLDKWNKERLHRADSYNQLIKESGLLKDISLPFVKKDRDHIYHQYTIKVLGNENPETRDKLRDFLKTNNIGAEIYYPLPLHLQECFNYLGYKKGDLPESEKAALSVLSLPMYPELTPEMQKYVVDKIKEFFL
ncbi:MAG TPA: DegT/DnrJ/EryC1/StrS family aminotransferase [Planctomycetota bacterium]|nr:DegT/DnrJ/EryC1/StrS family aminotransferase [Planctomycetota bacterium]